MRTNHRLSTIGNIKPSFRAECCLFDDLKRLEMDSSKPWCDVIIGAHIHRNPSWSSIAQANIAFCNIARIRAYFCCSGMPKHHGSVWVNRITMCVEPFSNPKEFFVSLQIQRHARIVTCVDQTKIIEDDVIRKVIHPH